jgi:hypothetical protein
MNWADWPLEAATAATPPSRAAILFSKTSYGFPREIGRFFKFDCKTTDGGSGWNVSHIRQ